LVRICRHSFSILAVYYKTLKSSPSTSKQNIGNRTRLSDVRKKKKYINIFGSFMEPFNCVIESGKEAITICPSVCPSVCHVGGSYCQTSFRPDCPIIHILIPCSAVSNSKGNHFFREGQKYWGIGKILCFLTKIAVCRWFCSSPVNER